MSRIKMPAMAMAAVLWSATASPAISVQGCAPRDALAAVLAEDFQERMDWVGVSSVGTLFELYVSKSGTWTIIVSTADGMSCIVAAGDYWERPTPPATGA